MGQDTRPCDVAWIRDLRDQGRAAGAAVFVKQLGSDWVRAAEVADIGCRLPPRVRHPKGGDLSEWAEDLRVREFPEVR